MLIVFQASLDSGCKGLSFPKRIATSFERFESADGVAGRGAYLGLFRTPFLYLISSLFFFMLPFRLLLSGRAYFARCDACPSISRQSQKLFGGPRPGVHGLVFATGQSRVAASCDCAPFEREVSKAGRRRCSHVSSSQGATSVASAVLLRFSIGSVRQHANWRVGSLGIVS
jgi:hypothetical protein